LTTISKNLFYRTAQYIENKSIEYYKQALKEIYNKAGFRIIKIQGDNELQLLKDTMFDEFEINMNFAKPQEYVLDAERINPVIKERVRATFHRLPYKQITKTMTKILVMEAAKRLNFFPAKQGIS
jgi:ribosome-interacting GTPase 1